MSPDPVAVTSTVFRKRNTLLKSAASRVQVVGILLEQDAPALVVDAYEEGFHGLKAQNRIIGPSEIVETFLVFVSHA